MTENKYIALAAVLENYIRDHKISGRLPGVHRLADELRVNHVTLRRAVQYLVRQQKLRVVPYDGTYVIHPETARKKFHVMGFLGFSNKGETVEQLFDDLNYSLSSAGYQVMNIACNPQLFDANPELLTKFPVDGFALFGAVTRKIADALLAAGLPAICTVNRNFPEFNHVGMDHLDGYTRAIRLLRESGCRRIGYLGYKRNQDFLNYLQDIHQVFVTELGGDFEPKFFQIRDHIAVYRAVGEKYHETIVREILKQWNPDCPDAVITLHSAAPFFKRMRPAMKVAEFSTNFFPETFADVSFYEDNAAMLELAARRLLEILNGDSQIKEIRIPFIMKNHTLKQ